jgi:hypothetical protein
VSFEAEHRFAATPATWDHAGHAIAHHGKRALVWIQCIPNSQASKGAGRPQRGAAHWFPLLALQPIDWLAHLQLAKLATVREELLELSMMKIGADFGHSCETAFDRFSVHTQGACGLTAADLGAEQRDEQVMQ